jgi:UDP-N-acetyl-D-glucosamine dehydrogenase
MTVKQTLIDKLQDRSAVIGIVGLGYVGLPLCVRCVEVGYRVIGFDTDPDKVSALVENQKYIEHIDIENLLPAGERFHPTSDFSQSVTADVIVLCVPTPLNSYRQPDLSYVIGSVEAIAPYLHQGQVVSLESTTYPGTTEEELRPRLEKPDLKCGEDFYLVYSPEREDPANPEFTTHTIPKIVGGSTPVCLEVGQVFYQNIVDTVIPVSSTQTAEMAKILENTYRAVNVALVNELKLVADAMDIDIFEVIRAAATKPFGFKAFYPGPGLGGHCIPIDPFYLTWKARTYNVATKFIELAGEINTQMPDHVVSKVIKALNDQKKAPRGAKVLVLGVAYKKNVGDVRESPSLVIIEKLLALGADVAYSDPHVPRIPKMRRHNLDMESALLSDETLAAVDCVLIATDHDRFDWTMIATHAPVIVDSRGVYSSATANLYRA